MRRLPGARYQTIGVDLPEADISDVEAMGAFGWSRSDIIVNATAWANADGAGSLEGRPMTWRTSMTGPANFAKAASTHGLALVHISTEYIFDGSCSPHLEDEAPSSLGAYVQARAGGDAAIIAAPKHYLVRISWVIGDGKNPPRQILELASQGVVPQVVFDQMGRLTFASGLAAGILHLLETKAEYSTYNLSEEGPVVSRASTIKRVCKLAGRDPDEVAPVLTREYFLDRGGVAPRPLVSALDLDKIKAIDFTPVGSVKRFGDYIRSLLESKGD